MPEPTLFERLQKQVEEQKKLQDIICPVCCAVFSDCEDLAGHVTYWGDDEPQEFECSACEAVLMVDEQVAREFIVTVKDKEPKDAQ